MPLFILNGREVTQPGVAPVGVVPALDEIEDRHLSFGLGEESAPIERLARQCGEETLAHRVVEAVIDRSHRRANARFPAEHPEHNRSVLRTLVGVMHNLDGFALLDRHVERLQDQLGAQMVLHGSANHAPAEGVDEHHQEQNRSPSWEDLRDISHPPPAGAVGTEVMLHQIRGRTRIEVVQPRRAYQLVAAYALQPRQTHEPCYTLSTYTDTLLVQFEMNARRPIGAPRVLVNQADVCKKRVIIGTRQKPRGAGLRAHSGRWGRRPAVGTSCRSVASCDEHAGATRSCAELTGLP